MRVLAILILLAACTAEEKKPETVTAQPETAQPTTAQPETAQPAPTATIAENQTEGTWSGQVKIDAHGGVSMFNYVGAESGDFAPMRFRNDSEAGKKILAACGDDDLCEFKGVVEWLDETPPENASAIGQIIRVDSVRRLPDDSR